MGEDRHLTKNDFVGAQRVAPDKTIYKIERGDDESFGDALNEISITEAEAEKAMKNAEAKGNTTPNAQQDDQKWKKQLIADFEKDLDPNWKPGAETKTEFTLDEMTQNFRSKLDSWLTEKNIMPLYETALIAWAADEKNQLKQRTYYEGGRKLYPRTADGLKDRLVSIYKKYLEERSQTTGAKVVGKPGEATTFQQTYRNFTVNEGKNIETAVQDYLKNIK